jgi:hypothetical protein
MTPNGARASARTPARRLRASRERHARAPSARRLRHARTKAREAATKVETGECDARNLLILRDVRKRRSAPARRMRADGPHARPMRRDRKRCVARAAEGQREDMRTAPARARAPHAEPCAPARAAHAQRWKKKFLKSEIFFALGLARGSISRKAARIDPFDSDDQIPSLLFRSALTDCGLALPPVSFITCPTNHPSMVGFACA